MEEVHSDWELLETGDDWEIQSDGSWDNLSTPVAAPTSPTSPITSPITPAPTRTVPGVRRGRPYGVSRLKSGKWLAKLPREFGNPNAALYLGVCDTAEQAAAMVVSAVHQVTEQGIGAVEEQVAVPGLEPYLSKYDTIRVSIPNGTTLEPSFCERSGRVQRSGRDKRLRQAKSLGKKDLQRAMGMDQLRQAVIDRIDLAYSRIKHINPMVGFHKAASMEAKQIYNELDIRDRSLGLDKFDLVLTALWAIRGVARTGDSHTHGKINSKLSFRVCPSVFLQWTTPASWRDAFGAAEFMEHCVQWDYFSARANEVFSSNISSNL
jgi:hypothetical protein